VKEPLQPGWAFRIAMGKVLRAERRGFGDLCPAIETSAKLARIPERAEKP